MVEEITCEQLRTAALKVTLIDVREHYEHDNGHISSSLLIPLGQLTKERLEQEGVHTTDRIIAYCRSGTRSAEASHMLKQWGYAAMNLKGGILKWASCGFELETNK